MEFPVIPKPGPFRANPNLVDYPAARREFSWEKVAGHLGGPDEGMLNIAYECVDRPAAGPLRDHEALRWLGRHGDRRSFTYGDLSALTGRFASGLRSLGVGPGDRVFTLAHRIPELYVAGLGTLKNGSVLAPLFSAFGPEPIATRMTMGGGTVLVTTDVLYRRKIEPIRDRLESLAHIVVVPVHGGGPVPGTTPYADVLAAGSPATPAARTRPEDLALLHFTSGTTGTPKGAMHVHGAVLHHYASALYALDLHPEDVFWCTADPGWVTGTSYGMIAPFLHGVTSVVDEADLDPDRWYGILQDEGVTVWYTAPTAVRMLMKAGADIPGGYDLSGVRLAASVGEPLNPEAVVWANDVLGFPIHDNWWQTETGGIMIANYAATEIRPGSMGRPLPGVEATILARDENGNVVLGGDGTAREVSAPFVEGELGLRPGWPSMFRGYLGMEERYRSSFAGGWYRTGDLAERDPDGWFWFVGRADDVIKSAGHLIGPFEVESALMEHPAVAEAGVIGVPDDVAGEVVKAYVSLNPGYEWGDPLRRDILGFARTRLGAAVAPREIEHEPTLPRTRSGKIMRRLLKAWALGMPTGDTSTLEGGEEA